MTDQVQFVASWSGGKDSCYAMMHALKKGMVPKMLLNMMNENGKISRSHGIPEKLLKQQAESIGLPIKTISTSWKEYEEKFVAALQEIKDLYNTNTVVFGDIDLDEHKAWEEKVSADAGMVAHLPLWKQDRKELVLEMLNSGLKTYIVSCNNIMGKGFLGRLLDQQLIKELEAIGVDPCGENGEYHTLVVDCPIFKVPVEVEFGQKLQHENYWFIEMV